MAYESSTSLLCETVSLRVEQQTAKVTATRKNFAKGSGFLSRYLRVAEQSLRREKFRLTAWL